MGSGLTVPARAARPSLGQAARRVLLLVGVALLGAACGGPRPAGVASLGSTTTTTRAPTSQASGSSNRTTAKYRAAFAYVDCMRSHGVPDFPDPTSTGALNVTFQTGGKGGSPVSSGIDRNSPQYISAAQECRHLLPGGVPSSAQDQQALAKGLRFAQCMRSHGVANFPDPSTAGVVHLGAGIDVSSPQFQDAQKLCQSLVPGGGK